MAQAALAAPPTQLAVDRLHEITGPDPPLWPTQGAVNVLMSAPGVTRRRSGFGSRMSALPSQADIPDL